MDPRKYQNLNSGRCIRTQTGYWAFIPAPLPPVIEWSTELVSALSAAERALAKLSSLTDTTPGSALISQSFVRYEAVVSSRIEGTRASLENLLAYETTQIPLIEQSGDAHEVYNYVRALDYGLERLKSLPISLRFIRELHKIVLENVRGGALATGEFRRTQNWIGPAGSTPSTPPYVPPPVQEMVEALDAMERYIHSKSQFPALIRAAFIHYQFEAIHPFLDGNGRVGRLLIVLLFYYWNLLTQPILNLSIYFERFRQEYYDRLLAISQNGEWDSWLLFFLRGVTSQAQESLVRLENIRKIRTRWQTLIDADRNSPRMSAFVDFILTRPIFSIRQVVKDMNIPFKTAQDYVDKLVNAGILREITGYTRNRIYQSDEIIRAIQGLEG